MLPGQFLMPRILATPLLLLVALWREGAALRAYLLCNSVALILMVPLMMHRMAPLFAEGTTQRLFGLVVSVPVGVAGMRWFGGGSLSSRQCSSL
jgi:hypothetical protein